MTLYDELVARGLIAQVTDEEEIKELINNGKAVFYIGFDPTADSLHVGHFMALCLMKRLQMAGNKPIALIGGGTAMIGDPSGRTDMRQMMTPETIQHNVDCFKKQMSRFIDFGEGKAMLVNNADWLMDLNYIDVLRDVGAHFSVNRMLTAECYKQRMEKGLSFLEFNYMIMQSYDFYLSAPATYMRLTDLSTAWHRFLRCHQRKCAVFILCTQQHALGQYSGKFCRL
jgi:tyrosyl-tRNA synthetase